MADVNGKKKMLKSEYFKISYTIKLLATNQLLIMSVMDVWPIIECFTILLFITNKGNNPRVK